MNHFVDEKAQNVYCIIDKSRVMKMPFEGMTLLDYSINASLVLADLSLRKGDKSGLITFEDKVDEFVKAGSRNLQLYQLMEALYRQQTSFKEPDVAAIYHFLRANINQRSLLLFFTNYESIHSLNRQLKYLQLINRDHLLLVIYFKNTEVDALLRKRLPTCAKYMIRQSAIRCTERKSRSRKPSGKPAYSPCIPALKI